MEKIYLDHFLGTLDGDTISDFVDFVLTHSDYYFKVTDYVSNKNFWDWKNLGLLDMKNFKSGKKQRKGVTAVPTKMNLVGYFWINIVADLRKFGLSTNKIRDIKDVMNDLFNFSQYNEEELSNIKKEQLEYTNKIHFNKESDKTEALDLIEKDQFINIVEDESNNFTLLCIAIMALIFGKKDIIFSVNSDGEGLIYINNQVAEKHTTYFNKPHFNIPLRYYLKPLISDENMASFVSKHKILSPEEEKILDTLRKEDVSDVHIKMKSGKPIMITVDRHNIIDLNSRISDIFLKGGYEEITLKTEYGRIVFSKSSQKDKLSK